jgi:hypothetical protein
MMLRIMKADGIHSVSGVLVAGCRVPHPSSCEGWDSTRTALGIFRRLRHHHFARGADGSSLEIKIGDLEQ